MGTSNKQIGWSQEANLMWEISKELDQVIKVAGSVSSSTTTTTTTIAP
jgi:hypothetical protein